METTTNREGNMTTTEKLTRNMLATYYRMDRGESSGRQSTLDNLDWNWNRLKEALAAGGYEELDCNPKLAAKYAKLERRHLLGRAAA
jgi:hypothetical protein